MAVMLVVYKSPRNAEAFDRHYFDIHVPLAKELPGLLKYEVSDGLVTTPRGASHIHRVGMLHFEDRAMIDRAFASPQGRVAAADRRVFAPDDSKFQMLLFNTREV